MNREERLNIITDEQCDLVQQHATGPRGARSSTGLCASEMCALLIWGSKITSRMKDMFTQQLLDGDIIKYLMEKEHWNVQHFESIG
jgi:hypothetical protein